MSKIDELIQQLCPDGIEWKTLNNISTNLDSKRKPVKGSDRQLGKYPYYGASGIVDYVSEYIFDGDFLLISEDGANLIARNTPIAFSISGKTWVNNHAHVLKFDNYSTRRLVEIYLNSIDLSKYISGASQPKLNKENLYKIPIPVPPLPIQHEIVSILDQFAFLETELKAELEARRTQYNYYRNQLLSFEDKEVEWKTLGEIGQFIRGKRFVKDDIVAEGIPCIHYGEMYTHYHISASKTKSFLNSSLAAKLRVANTGDVIIVAAGETVEDLGKGVAWLGESDVVIHDACFAFKHKLYPKYVSHFLQTELFRSQIKRNVSSGKISAINASGLSKATIPIPPPAEQVRIAGILDKFDALVNDLSVGLPAEIAARRKQYEYYRGRLLDFKCVSNG